MDQDKIQETNERAIEYLGYSQKKLIGMPVVNIDPGLTLQRLESYESRLQPGQYLTITSVLNRKDKQVLPAEINIGKLSTAKGEALYILFRDITNRWLLEQQLNKKEQTNILLENALDAYVGMDVNGIVTSWNTQAESTFGWNRDEAIGQKLAELIVPAELRPMHQAGLNSYLDNGDSKIINQRIQVKAIHKEGYEFDVELTVIPIRSEHQQISFGAFLRPIDSLSTIPEKQKQLKEEYDFLARFNDVLVSLGTEPDANIQQLTSLCGELLHGTCALYSRLEGDNLNSIGQWQTPADYQQISLAEGRVCHDVINSDNDNVWYIKDLQQTSYIKTDNSVKSYGLKSYYGKSIPVNGEDVGTLCVVYTDTFEPAEHHSKILYAIGSAIENEEKKYQQINHYVEQDRRYEHLVEHGLGLVCTHDTNGVFLSANNASLEMSGYTPEEVIGHSIKEFFRGDDVELNYKMYMRKLNRDGSFRGILPLSSKTGKPISWYFSSTIYNDDSGNSYILGHAQDITEHERDKNKLRQHTRVLEVLNQANDVLLSSKDEMQLMAKICQIIVNVGKYTTAWVGFPENDSVQSIKPVARYGDDKGYIDQLDINLTDKTKNKGPTATAIRTGFPYIVRDIDNDKNFTPWHDAAISRGFQATASFPLQTEEEIFGALMMYSTNKDVFSEDEQLLLNKLADNLAYGIKAIQRERSNKRNQYVREIESFSYRLISDEIPLKEALDQILLKVEQFLSETKCSILLVDKDGKHLRQGAAPSLPQAYNNAIDGVRIGPEVGSCGSAVFYKEQVIVANIQTDRRWKDFLKLAKTYNLRACYSTPVFNVAGEVIGTFANYKSEPMQPDDYELQLINDTSNIISNLIERKQTNEKLLQSEKHYRSIFNSTNDAIFVVDLNSLIIKFANKRAIEFTGYAKEELEGLSVEALHPHEMERVKAFVEKILKHDYESSDELTCLNKKGECIQINASGSLIEFNDNPCVLMMVRDLSDRQKLDKTLTNLTKGLSATTGHDFFATLAESLCNILDADYVGIGELDEQAKAVSTITLSYKGKIIENVTYDLNFAPCEHVIHFKKLCLYPDNIQKHFPNDEMLSDLNIEAYAGMPLIDSDGVAIGLVFAMSESKLETDRYVEQAFSLFAARATAELERIKSERTLETISNNAPIMITYADTSEVYLYANSFFTEVFKDKQGNVVGSCILDTVGKHDYQKIKDHLKIAYSGQTEKFEFYSEGDDFHRRCFEVMYIPEFDSKKDVKGIYMLSIDITERKHAEHELTIHSAAMASAREGIALLDNKGKHIFTNQAYCNIFGYDNPESMTGISWRELYTEMQLQEFNNQDTLNAFNENGFWNSELTCQRSNGALTNIDISVSKLDSGEIITLCRDITNRKQRENMLLQSESRFRELYNTAPMVLVTIDEYGAIKSINRYGEKALGYSEQEIIGKDVFELVVEEDKLLEEQLIHDSKSHPGDSVKMQIRKKCNDGSVKTFQSTAKSSIDDSGRLEILVACLDITEQQELSEQLSHQSRHDLLTGLANRYEFENRISNVLESSETPSTHALCYIDLDQFKVINDTSGHMAGDELLRLLSKELAKRIRKKDLLARLGGDEFAILIENCSLSDAERVANEVYKLIQGFNFTWDERHHSITASIGLVPFNNQSQSVTEILGMADAACFTAKDTGRNRVHLYDSDDVEVQKRHGDMQWISRINKALKDNQLVLYSQPIIALNDELIIKGEHFEILVRMRTDDGAIVPPASFLPAAERYYLSMKIDEWVIDNTFKWLSDEKTDIQTINKVSINLSGHSLGNGDFLNRLQQRMINEEIDCALICFEITETAAIGNMSVANHFINTFRNMGCEFALDDFGSGLSSLSYLKNLQVDYLKIDGMFVKDINDDPADLAMVESIARIGKVLGKKIVAEYVESEAIMEILKDIGVDYVQGYHVGEPKALFQ